MEKSFFCLSRVKSVDCKYPVLTLFQDNGNKITFVGTAHVSKHSVKDVRNAIKTLDPDCIAVELDQKRLNFLQKKNYHDLNIFQILRSGQGYFFFAQLLLVFYQKSIANQVGSEPGAEMKEAVLLANKKRKKLLLIDRPAEITLRRVVKSMGIFRCFGAVASLLGFDEDSFSQGLKAAEVKQTKKKTPKDFLNHMENLRKESVVQRLRKHLRSAYPKVVTALLDERDFYMAKMIEKEMQKKKKYHLLAVVGAAHMRGMVEAISGTPVSYNSSISELLVTPKKGWGWRSFSYGVVFLIVSVFIWGFIVGDYSVIKEGFLTWFLINGILSALGGCICLAHPLTIIAAFFVAPFASLNPALPTGVVCAMVEALMRPPKMEDFEKLELKIASFRLWWHNRFSRIFLVFFFTNLGSALGTWIALSVLFRLFF